MASKKKLPSNVYFWVIGLHISTAALFCAPPCYEGNVKLARMRRQLLRKALSSQEMYKRGNRAKASRKQLFPPTHPLIWVPTFCFSPKASHKWGVFPPRSHARNYHLRPSSPLLSTNVSQPPVVGERARGENECFFSHVHAGIFSLGNRKDKRIRRGDTEYCARTGGRTLCSWRAVCSGKEWTNGDICAYTYSVVRIGLTRFT